MFETIAERLNLKNYYIDSKAFNHYGYRYDDGTFTQLFYHLKRREIDLVFVQLLPNESYADHFDMLYPHLDDSFTWWAPTALISNSWYSILRIFDGITWGIIIATILITPLVWKFSNYSQEGNRYVFCYTII